MTDRKPTCVACKVAGGATYTAGTGIVIESNEISADTSVLATKTELPDMDNYQPKLTAGSGITIDTDNVIDVNTSGIKSMLESWGLVENSTEYLTYVSDNKLTTDMIVEVEDNISDYMDIIYLRKGTDVSGFHFIKRVHGAKITQDSNNTSQYSVKSYDAGIYVANNQDHLITLSMWRYNTNIDTSTNPYTITYTTTNAVIFPDFTKFSQVKYYVRK